MKCPNCNSLLDDDANICFACATVITEAMRKELLGKEEIEFNEVIQNLISEAEEQPVEMPTAIAQRRQANQKREIWKKRYRLVSYLTIGVIVLFSITLFLRWYSISGKTAFRGFFYTEKTAKGLSAEVKSYQQNEEAATATGPMKKVASFSPYQLYRYAGEYDANSSPENLLERLQVYYAKSLFLIWVLLIASVLILIFDREAKLVEGIRIASIISAIYILLNSLAMKLPYINFFVLHAKKMLHREGISSSVVGEGLHLFDSSKEILPYQMQFHFGWMAAIFLAGVWFLLATVLGEFSRMLEKKEQ